MSIDDGKATQITRGGLINWSPRWSRDSESLYFVSNGGGAMDLWRQRIDKEGTPAGNSQRITSGMELRSVALSHDGTKLAYSKGRMIGNIWRMPIPRAKSAELTWKDMKQLTFEQNLIWSIDVSHDGSRLLFDIERNGVYSTYTVTVDTSATVGTISSPIDTVLGCNGSFHS